MNELNERFARAVNYILEMGMAQSQSEIAKKLDISKSTLNMAIRGGRLPNTDLLLAISDNYPINFWWLRSGEGNMKEDKVSSMRKRITELENEVRILKGIQHLSSE